MLGCLPQKGFRKPEGDTAGAEVVTEERPKAAEEALRATLDASKEQSTAARCLVYVRSGTGQQQLLEEVKRRVPASLQERIDAKNQEFLRKSIDEIVTNYIQCARRLTAHDSEEVPLASGFQEMVEIAAAVRAEGGMGRARVFLLRACWRQYIPWLPEELSPTSSPPDFRMFYGQTCRRILLDSLIARGQHDLVSLLSSNPASDSSLVPREMQAWFTAQGL